MVAGGPEGDGRADERSSGASPTAGRPRRLKGRFVLSINDVPQVRELFGGFALEPVELNYTISDRKAKPARELIVGG